MRRGNNMQKGGIMCRVTWMDKLPVAVRRRIWGVSLLETVVASVVFLTLFMATLDMLPHLTIRDDKAQLEAEAMSQIDKLAKRCGSAAWSEGDYVERYEWGSVVIRVAPYQDFEDVRIISISARINGSPKRIGLSLIAEYKL